MQKDGEFTLLRIEWVTIRHLMKKFSMANSYSVSLTDRSVIGALIEKWAGSAASIGALAVMLWLTGFPTVAQAQSAADFKIEVVVADQAENQRSSAYWLALDRILRRNMPDAITDPDQRAKVLREASRYVQSFRYRRFNIETDSGRLATRKVRDGAAADSVIVVTFPVGLEDILRQQAAPSAVVETNEQIGQPEADILALIAVDQEASQFLIGGNRGSKFQVRMTQLGATNSLSFQFPALDRADQELISAADVLYNQPDPLDAIMSRYETDRRLGASLFRLSEQVWQTEWRYVVAGQTVKTLNLTTRTLDEALVTALSELGGSGAGYRADNYLGQSGAFQRDGVGLRVENVNTLADYQSVLAALKKIEPTLITESLEAGAIIFRAPKATLSNLQQSIARMPQLSLMSTGAVAGAELVAQFVPR